ncbi:hypothetical protein [Chryseobacterium flavum]|uniref:hypothetical protein n=1 Tax=Chryseobacterium flavum TaxID=415851 RepID=UPI0028A795A4|nr:hypothetical protein [Chryseobacterium flavum]
MKKTILIMSIFSFLNCSDKKIFIGDENFIKKEIELNIDSKKADSIYEETFKENFSLIRDENFENDYEKVIFIQNDFYYIGYASKLDKRGKENPHLNYLLKINPKNQETFVIK